jgi:glycosyltransferase involved in cell wall biosynthesis
MKVAYVMSRFPKISETFVLYEMLAMQKAGVEVELFPLLHERRGPRHPEAVAMERRAHFFPFLSWRIVAANIRRLIADPRRYLAVWREVLSGTAGSLNFFCGALAFLPKCLCLAERMERLGVQHVHAHFANHPALAALIVHRLTGIPFSFTAHGSDLHVDRRMLRQKVSAAAFVVTVSAYNRELIVQECGEEVRPRVHVIHCGPQPAFARASEAPPRAPDGHLRIACIASLEEVKGHRFLLEACRLLAADGVRFRCDLVGGGPLRASIEQRVVSLGLSDRVVVHGPRPGPEVARVLREADVVALASYPTRSGKREGIPVALMEAMALGLPVVASGLSGIPELVEHERTGLLVNPGDPWSLADALRRLADDPCLRARLGTAARERVAERFDLERGVSRLRDAILEAAS